MDKKRRRIAVAGSAGNPPTLAHRGCVEVLTHSGLFDHVIWSLSGRRPDKPALVDPVHRIAMTRLLFSDDWQREQPISFELDFGDAYIQSTPTYFLLKKIEKEFPDAELVFATGVDVLEPRDEYGGTSAVLHYWQHGKDLLAERRLAVFPRHGFTDPKTLIAKGYLPKETICLTSQPEEYTKISSSLVRALLKEGENVGPLVGEQVANYIKSHGLYI